MNRIDRSPIATFACGVVLEQLERVIEEPLALADRRGQFVHPLAAAGREQDRDRPAAVAGPRQEVAEGDEIDEVVGVKVPDDDRIEAREGRGSA